MFSSFEETFTPVLTIFGDDTLVALRDSAATFSKSEIRPLDEIIDKETHAFPPDLWEQLGEQGYLNLITPEENNGIAQGYLALVEVTKQLSKNSGSIGLSYIAHIALCLHQIIKHGTAEQKAKYLPGLSNGTLIGALAMSEPNAGSDVMSMKTRATRREDGSFILNGGKFWITNGGRKDPKTGQPTTADVMVVYAVTDPEKGKLTAFLLERGMPGFEAVAKIQKEGVRGSETWEITFNDVVIPAENVLGAVNKGANVLMAGLNAERLILAAGALGLAEAAYEEALAYTAETRKQFGMPIAHNQDVAFRLAQIYADITAANALMIMQAAMADKNIPLDNAAAAAVFLQASQVATRATEENTYLHGGSGMTTDVRAMRLKRDAALYRVGGGSEAIRLLRIAEETIPGFREHTQAVRAMVREQHRKAAVGAPVNDNPPALAPAPATPAVG